MGQRQKVLGKGQIDKKVMRLAHEIVEQNFEQKKLCLLGIKERGYLLCQQVAQAITEVQQTHFPAQEFHLAALTINKKNPFAEGLELENAPKDWSSWSVVVVDDVLYTGKTLFHALKPFMEHKVEKLATMVLVDREYHKYPVSADFTGYHLSTTLQDHVEVELENEPGVYLS